MKCKDLAIEFETTAMRIGKIRRKLFPHASGILTKEEIDGIRNHFKRKLPLGEEVNKFKPDIVICVVTYALEGKRIVEGMVPGESGRFPVLLPFGMNGVALLGKKIKIERIKSDGKWYYRHASLANNAWKFQIK